MTRRRPLALLLCASLALACQSTERSSELAPSPSQAGTGAGPEPALADWTDARTRELAASRLGDQVVTLELAHLPAQAGDRPTLELRLVQRGQATTLWSDTVDPARRDQLWNASWLLAIEPEPGDRLALSMDEGATFMPVFDRAHPFLCPHERVAGVAGQPDWTRMPTLDRWAADVLQTAVWGCGENERGCRARSLAGATVHHSEPQTEALAREHAVEVRHAVAVLDRLPPSRRLAAALVDASVGHQAGLDAGQLRALGTAAARALGPDGPLGPEERRALSLRVLMAREELKKAPPARISPRVSIEALSAALEEKPRALGR
jgi:hypothetical protein